MEIKVKQDAEEKDKALEKQAKEKEIKPEVIKEIALINAFFKLIEVSKDG